MVSVGFEPGTFQTGIQRFNHSSTAPPIACVDHIQSTSESRAVYVVWR